MINRTRFSTVGALGLALSVAGCGGGGGSSSSGSLAPAPDTSTSTAMTTSGVITGFGSVFVNGKRYGVAGDTVVSVENEGEFVGDDSRLRVGMKVRIHARNDDGEVVAERIEYDDDLKGPARNVSADAGDPSLGSFTVLGQMVRVDADTVFDDDVGDTNGDGTIDIRDLELPSGQMVVEVSGLVTNDGIVASRIDRVNSAAGVPGTPDDEFEVKGFVDAVAADGSSFEINGTVFLVVEGAGGTEFEDGLTADESLVGVYVEVEADEDASGNLIAVKVEREDEIGDRDDDGDLDDDDRFGELEIEGILTSVDTSGTPHVVVINGTTLQVEDASALVGREGIRIELEGTFNEDGVLVLSKTQVEAENTVRTEDQVSAVDTAAGTITTRLGLEIVPTGDSRVQDDRDEGDDGHHLTPAEFLDRVLPGSYIEARGFPNPDGTVTWRRIELDDEDDQSCELRGPVESIDGTSASDFSFVIQGVTIDVSQITSDDGFEGVEDDALGRQAFFDTLAVGDLVKAGSDDAGLGCQPGTLTAREVEFEHGDDVVGSSPDDGDDDAGEAITGTPGDVGHNSFVIGGRTITVTGSTRIDDSLIELALGREFDDDDRRFDQLPEGLTLPELLTGGFDVTVTVNDGDVALRIEDLD